MSLIEKFEFEGQKDGPNILLTGRIHGNEPAGEFALKRLIGRLASHSIELKSGKLTIMPCCNPEATKANKRFTDVNLNRIISADLAEKYKNTNEGKLAVELMKAVDECDISVDLHTFTENMDPLVICIDDQNPKSRNLATTCGLKRIECDSPHISQVGTQMLLHYARHKRKPAILIESGQHQDQNAVETAYHTLLNLLISHQLIDGHMSENIAHEFLVIRGALYNRENEKLIFPLNERTSIEHGDALYETNDGTIIHADQGGHLFMRNINTPVGEEYAYICDVLNKWP